MIGCYGNRRPWEDHLLFRATPTLEFFLEKEESPILHVVLRSSWFLNMCERTVAWDRDIFWTMVASQGAVVAGKTEKRQAGQIWILWKDLWHTGEVVEGKQYNRLIAGDARNKKWATCREKTESQWRKRKKLFRRWKMCSVVGKECEPWCPPLSV